MVNGEEGTRYKNISSLTFGSNSIQLIYIAQLGSKQFVVVDGKEGIRYDGVSALTFTPDYQHLAYVAQGGNKQFVVFDETEGKQYDNIVTEGGGQIIFDSADSFHYLVLEGGNTVYLIEERIE